MVTARILVVDDEPGILGLVSRALSLRGYEVHVASSPMKALELAKAMPCFDLVVSDVIMPEMCGPELVRKIAEICPNAAVVLMSAYVDAEAVPERAGFIGKPFIIPDLYSIVERKLAVSRGGAGG